MTFSTSLPAGWVSVPIGEVADIVTGTTPSTKHPEFYGGEIPFVKPGDLDRLGAIFNAESSLTYEGASQSRLLPVDSVLVSCIGNLGKVGILGVESSCNQQINALIPTDGIDPRFVYHWVKTIRAWLEANASATTVTIINKSRFSAAPFLFPPLNEQRRIVAKIEELTARSRRAREALEAVPPLLEQLRQSVLAAAFSGRLTADWREDNNDVEPASVLLERIRTGRRRRWEENELAKLRAKGKEPKDDRWKAKYKEPTPVDTTGLPTIPDTWQWASWDDLADWITYGFTRPVPHVDAGIPVITAKNVRDGWIDFSEPKFTTEEVFSELSEKDKPRRNEILITKDGAIRGRAAVVETDARFCVSQAVAVVRFGGLTAHVPYLLRVIQSPFTQLLIEEQSAGMAIPHISITQFGKFPVPIPPLQEQRAIASRVAAGIDLVSQHQTMCELAFGQFEQLNQSILAKAFRGELVPQDPNDEPASVLLERIRAQRAAAEAEKKTKKKKPSRPSHHRNEKQNRKDAKTAKNPTDDLQTVLHFLQSNPGPHSKNDILTRTNLDPTTWQTLAPQLTHHPQIQRTGQKRGTRYFCVGAETSSETENEKGG